jgi:hypothetical protein
MPADWAMTRENLGLVLVVRAERTAGQEGVALLEQAIVAFQSALTIFTPEHMPYNYEKAQRHLAHAEAAIAKAVRG